ncbi:MAG: MBOAT family O-acyltransferase, partial [Desulfovibrionaceae bacterium]|nr:MBOAT family O-acyltransferase [Desulfovibrionaceae bacterium]
QLIAGPIVRYEQIGPQLDRLRAPSSTELACGLGLFVTGLAKKVLLADWLASHADAVFSACSAGFPLSTAEAWLGTLSFSLQIYFDFSSYCDMAMGIGVMAGLRLPDNFAAPYRATGFIEFWRRWHITFSVWLRDCVFRPLAGQWPSPVRLLLGMAGALAVAGLWHGPALTFLVWAGVHGLMLLLNIIVRAVRGPALTGLLSTIPMRLACVLMTFALVTLSWVIFRSDSLAMALDMYAILLGLTPAAGSWFANGCFTSWTAAVPLAAGLATVFVLPTARSVFLGRSDGSRAWVSFGLSGGWACALAATALACLAVMDRARPFLF